jgi:hypothetical protein
MKLFMVTGTGWATSFTLVQAESLEAAKALACEPNAEFEELDTSKTGVLWAHEYSPDSCDYGDG